MAHCLLARYDSLLAAVCVHVSVERKIEEEGSVNYWQIASLIIISNKALSCNDVLTGLNT